MINKSDTTLNYNELVSEIAAFKWNLTKTLDTYFSFKKVHL